MAAMEKMVHPVVMVHQGPLVERDDRVLQDTLAPQDVMVLQALMAKTGLMVKMDVKVLKGHVVMLVRREKLELMAVMVHQVVLGLQDDQVQTEQMETMEQMGNQEGMDHLVILVLLDVKELVGMPVQPGVLVLLEKVA